MAGYGRVHAAVATLVLATWTYAADAQTPAGGAVAYDDPKDEAPSGATSPTTPIPARPDRPQPTEAPEVTPIAPTRTLPVSGEPLPVPLPRTGAGRPLTWDPAWRRFDGWDWGLTVAAGTVSVASHIIKPIGGPNGGILFDEDVRDALRLEGYNQRGTARDVSDVLLSLSTAYPFLVDAMITAWWYRGSADVAKQMVLIDLETFTVAAAIQGSVTLLVGRERPYGRTCGGETPEESRDCDSFSRYRSYFSGHTSQTFTAAGLICTHHFNLNLFAHGPTDGITCISSFAAAASTGLLRIVGDMHYASDVITGAVIGTTVGLGLPFLLHYQRSGHVNSTARRSDGFSFHVVPTMTGAAAVGTF